MIVEIEDVDRRGIEKTCGKRIHRDAVAEDGRVPGAGERLHDAKHTPEIRVAGTAKRCPESVEDRARSFPPNGIG